MNYSQIIDLELDLDLQLQNSKLVFESQFLNSSLRKPIKLGGKLLPHHASRITIVRLRQKIPINKLLKRLFILIANGYVFLVENDPVPLDGGDLSEVYDK